MIRAAASSCWQRGVRTSTEAATATPAEQSHTARQDPPPAARVRTTSCIISRTQPPLLVGAVIAACVLKSPNMRWRGTHDTCYVASVASVASMHSSYALQTIIIVRRA